jgi:hypothetical protein
VGQAEKKRVTGQVAVYPPHEIIEWFLQLHPDLDPYSFDERRLPLVARLSDWKKRSGIREDQPVISLGVWGDSGRYNTRDSLYIITFNMLSSQDHRRFLFGAVPKKMLCDCGCRGRCTLDSFWKILKWSADHLLLGSWPSCRHDGSPFLKIDKHRQMKAGLGMHRGAFIQKRGDWSWLVQCLGLNAWNTTKRCWMCEADTEEFDWTDFDDAANWRCTHCSHDEFIARGTYLSTLFSLPGFLLDYVDLDVMHVVDLGILQYFLGSISLELLHSLGGKRGKDNWKHSLSQLLRLIKHSWKEVGLSVSPINDLTIGMLGGGTSKTVARIKTKAAETRGIAKCFGYILEFIFPPQSLHEQTRKRCLDSILVFYKCMGQNWDNSACEEASSALLSPNLFVGNYLF